jgi:hypothetical protein
MQKGILQSNLSPVALSKPKVSDIKIPVATDQKESVDNFATQLQNMNRKARRIIGKKYKIKIIGINGNN